MPFAAALSTEANTGSALEECLTRVNWTGRSDLAMAFFTPQHRRHAGQIAQTLSERLSPRCLLGCPGEAVIATGREIEGGPALSIWVARWNEDVELTPFHLTMEETSEGYSLLGWPDELAQPTAEPGLILALGDPFTFPVDDFLGTINEQRADIEVVGGMASGASEPGNNPLVIGSQVVDQGAVAVLLRGPIKARSVVSQGCRPIGRPLVITKAQENVIIELGGKSALEQLQSLWNELPARDQQLIQHGLHVGRVISEYRDSFGRGDFLIRNVIGLDRASGALAVTERVRVGQTVQFHLRDATTADEDLRLLLQTDSRSHSGKAGGGLLFSCNGRGTRLFAASDHDAQAIEAEKGAMPLAGFFAQGELGPVGGQNFIHGFTASLVLFDE